MAVWLSGCRAVWLLYQGAVDVEPPVTDEVLLVEEGSVGAEEGIPEGTNTDITDCS